MMKLGASRIAYQPGRCRCQSRPGMVNTGPLACFSMICDVDMEPAVMNTATTDSPMPTSYEIICADERSPPSSGYVDPDAQPPSTTPYTPMDEHASTSSTATGMSVSCNAVRCPNTETDGPNGITENAVNAH